jgi:hypothetical protein
MQRGCGVRVRTLWPLLAALVVVVPTVAVIVGLAPRAGAEVYTCGASGDARGNYFAGYYQNGNGPAYEGASAHIITEYGAVCDTDTSQSNFTAEWSMIANGDGAGWVQSGFLRWYNSPIHYFSQEFNGCPASGGDTCSGGCYGGSCDFNTVYGTSPEVGHTHTYIQKYDSANNDVQSIVDATVFQTTAWDPLSIWPDTSVQYFGEAAYLENDIAGNASTPTLFSSITGQLQSNDSFASVACSTLTHSNALAGKVRSDGESWWDRVPSGTDCPSFVNYTDTAG